MSKFSCGDEGKSNNSHTDKNSAGRSEYIEFLIMFILIMVAITVFFLLLKYFPKLVLACIGGLFLFFMLIGAACSGGGSSYRGSSGCSLYNRSLYESGNWYDYYKTKEYYNETK